MGRKRTHVEVMERAARERLLRLERQAKAREDENALEARLTETVALGEARGEEYDRAPQKRGEARKPIRRLTGLTWLVGKKRITEDQYEAGKRYASAYQKARGDLSIRSILDRDPTGAGGCSIAAMLASAEDRVYARERLAMYRGQLRNLPALVDVCDAVCGEEKTPREVAQNGREAEAIEAVLVVALDLMALCVAPPREVSEDVARAA